MKKTLSFLFSIFLFTALYSQVGIGTNDPKATLDITASDTQINQADAILIPRMTATVLANKNLAYAANQNGALVFITDGVGTIDTKTELVTGKGFYYYDNTAANGTGRWFPVQAYGNVFYAPSVVMPIISTDISTNPADDVYYTVSTQTFTVKLYSIYQKQFGMIGDTTGIERTAIKSSSISRLPIYTATELDYFVTYFDNKVFDPQRINLDANGVLTYTIIPTATVTEHTFMNVVFRAK